MGSSTRKNSENSNRGHLESIYKKLQDCAHRVSEGLESEGNSNDYLCLIVLEDDLSCLLEECRTVLLQTQVPGPAKLVSFESRCMTVFDEVELALGGDPDSSCHAIVWNEVIPAYSERK